jgi:hypothetical protein
MDERGDHTPDRPQRKFATNPDRERLERGEGGMELLLKS